MLKAGSASSRDVQKALALSSPTLAQHHLEKLMKYELVEKNNDGGYKVKPKSFGILKLYVRSGKWMVPRTVFFAMIFGVLTVGFVLSIPQHRYFLLASIVSAAGLAYAIYETYRFYKVLPKT